MPRKAVAYSSDIVLGRTGEVISREEQKKVIRQYAEENDLKIVAWFEDEICTEDILLRPGIQKLIVFDADYECVLVERIWCLSRVPKEVKRFLRELDSKSARLESATILWDCASQMARWYYKGDPMSRAAKLPRVDDKPGRKRVSKPDKTHFTGMKRNPGTT